MNVRYPDPTTISNRLLLKQATRAAHARAEARFVGPHGFRDHTAYACWLTAMMDVHMTVGLPAATVLDDAVLLTREDKRIRSLAHDLGVPVTRGQSIPDRSMSWAWGVQYVLQGSALGASMLLKSGTIRPEWPRAYLREMQHFATCGGLKQFFAALESNTIDPAEAIQGAKEAFPKV